MSGDMIACLGLTSLNEEYVWIGGFEADELALSGSVGKSVTESSEYVGAKFG